MPDYNHICINIECNHEWEDFYSITKDPPTTCPLCNKETAKRLISGFTLGVVELTGRDLIAKNKEDAGKIKQQMYGNEKMYSNMLGETRYQTLQKAIDRAKKER